MEKLANVFENMKQCKHLNARIPARRLIPFGTDCTVKHYGR